MSKGLMATKLGMSQKFDDNGKHIPVTLLKVHDNVVLEKRNGKLALGTTEAKAKHINKAQRVAFEKNKVPLLRHVKEFFCDDTEKYNVGDAIGADLFEENQYIDVSAKTKGRGFAGPIKRHNFKSQRKTHGVSLSERAHGSTGQCQDPGRVFKNKKMAGHYGDEMCTIQNLVVVGVDKDKKLLIVRGAVPGPKGGLVFVKQAVKKRGA